MRAVIVIFVLAISILWTIPVHSLEIENYDIDIANQNVDERIILEKGNNDTNLLLWIQGEARDVSIKINGTNANFSKSGNVFSVNLSNISKQEIVLSYTLSQDTEKFRKQIMYRCKEMSIKLNNEVVYQGVNLSDGTYISFLMENKVGEKNHYYMYTTLVLIILLISILAYFGLANRRREKGYETPELLKTKRDLLMTVLKEIEKKYRAKELDDDIYNRLKEHYKRETVNIVRKLEEISKNSK